MNNDLATQKPLPIELEVKIVTGQYDKSQLLGILEDHTLSKTQSNSVGNAFRLLGEYELAEKYFLKSIELSPTYDEPYANLISLYAHQNRFDLCTEIYQQGIKKRLKSPTLFIMMGE